MTEVYKCLIFSFSQYMYSVCGSTAEQRNKNQYGFIWTNECTINETEELLLPLPFEFFFERNTLAHNDRNNKKKTPISMSLSLLLSISFAPINWE